MKAFHCVLIILLVFSIGIGNERLMKVTEAASNHCSQIHPNAQCVGRQCEDSCKKQYGNTASGFCVGDKCLCVHSLPC
ncbi:uncharacterized protein DS421_14g473850 [Arachis hypogaea]|uniref:Knottin scorpion toxin-like domain-containing protein n=1 Tax=Arachis hypogaea TaxID=3818 RepID=A0A444ZM50_ARAHY|nr:uncharacterized protein DS421_14g473850 [Arachis hypogaea]RYR15243.1 hypothetical protein Ahy_B04g071969 [Arachis hypogaea]